MAFYKVTGRLGVPVVRQASSLDLATVRATIEFPAGVLSVELVGPQQMDAMTTSGYYLPTPARAIVSAWRAAATARNAKARKREATAAKRREAAQGKRDDLREQKRLEAAAKRAQKVADKATQKVPTATPVVHLEPVFDGPDDGSAPWD